MDLNTFYLSKISGCTVLINQQSLYVCTYVLFKANMDEVSLLDESYNRATSILSVQCKIACSSSCCEVNVLLELCKGLYSNHFDDQQVTKVMHMHVYIYLLCEINLLYQVVQQISHHHGYHSIIAYLEHYMIHLFYQWLNNGFDVESFPYQLFGKTTGQFYR